MYENVRKFNTSKCDRTTRPLCHGKFRSIFRIFSPLIVYMLKA